MATDFCALSSASIILIDDMKMTELVDLFNEAGRYVDGDDFKPVARFSDRKSAERRTKAVLDCAATKQFADRPATETEVTVIAPALAQGIEAAPNCKRSLDISKGRTKLKTDVFAERTSKTPEDEANAERRTAKPGTRIILKSNKVIRAALTAACKKLGGSRLEAEGFASYSEFLGGFPKVDGEVILKPVGGSGQVILIIDGDALAVQTAK